MVVDCVYYAVGTVSLNTIRLNFVCTGLKVTDFSVQVTDLLIKFRLC